MSELRLPWNIVKRAATLEENEELEVDTEHEGEEVTMVVSRKGGVVTAYIDESKPVSTQKDDVKTSDKKNTRLAARVHQSTPEKRVTRGRPRKDPPTSTSGQKSCKKGSQNAKLKSSEPVKTRVTRREKATGKREKMTTALSDEDKEHQEPSISSKSKKKMSKINKRKVVIVLKSCSFDGHDSEKTEDDSGIEEGSLIGGKSKRKRRLTDKYKQLLADRDKAKGRPPKSPVKAELRDRTKTKMGRKMPKSLNANDGLTGSQVAVKTESSSVADDEPSLIESDDIRSLPVVKQEPDDPEWEAKSEKKNESKSDKRLKKRKSESKQDQRLKKKKTELEQEEQQVKSRTTKKVDKPGVKRGRPRKSEQQDTPPCAETDKTNEDHIEQENERNTVENGIEAAAVTEDIEKSPVRRRKGKKSGVESGKRSRNKLLENSYFITESGERKCLYCQKVVTGGSIWHHIYKWCRESPLRQNRTYECRKCCETFEFFKDLQHHQAWHEEQRRKGERNICSICFEERCKRRAAPPRDVTKTHKCKVCGKDCDSADSLTMHQRSHPELYKFQCEFCGKAYKCKRDMDSHRQIKHLNPFKYNCVQCGIGLCSTEELAAHKCQVGENPVLSVKQMFTKRYALNTEILKDDREKIKLEEEDMPLSVEEVLDRDLDLPLTSAEQPEVTGKSRQGRKAKEGHVTGSDQGAELPKHYVCEFCGHRFLTAAGRYKHLTRKHGYKKFGVASQKGWCQLCDKHFSSTYYLNHHIKSLHLQEKAYECDICHKRFHMVKDCEYHKRTVHEGNYRYHCIKCGKGVHSKARSLAHHCNWGQLSREKAERRARKNQLRMKMQQNVKPSLPTQKDTVKEEVSVAMPIAVMPQLQEVDEKEQRHVSQELSLNDINSVPVAKQPDAVVMTTGEELHVSNGAVDGILEDVGSLQSVAEPPAAVVEVLPGAETSADDVDYTTIEIDYSEAILVENEAEGGKEYMVAYFDDSGNLVVQPTNVEKTEATGIL